MAQQERSDDLTGAERKRLKADDGPRAKILDASGRHRGPASVRYREDTDTFYTVCSMGHLHLTEIPIHDRDRWRGRLVTCSGTISGFGPRSDDPVPSNVIVEEGL